MELRFWSAIADVYPETQTLYSRVHKTANVLDKLSKRVLGEAKLMLYEIWRADTRINVNKVFKRFLATWELKYPTTAE